MGDGTTHSAQIGHEANGNDVLRVGCALLPKKAARYLTARMREIAAENGLELLTVDHTKPLQDQGPFDAIVHKLRPNQAWEQNLMDYCKLNPRVKVIDRVLGIKALQNRSTMLKSLQGNGVTVKPASGTQNGWAPARVRAPPQVEIVEGTSLGEAEAKLASAGLKPPLVVKPLWTDGRPGSHGLAVLHDLLALDKLLQGASCAAASESTPNVKPPLVVQQFVEHGGRLYKVYVLGEQTVVTQRPSLKNSYLSSSKGVTTLPRISCTSLNNKHKHEFRMNVGDEEANIAYDNWPPEWVTNSLAAILRKRLGVQLFNFDMICPEGDNFEELLYYVVDINYFPGVDKIPGFEELFVNFLKAVCEDVEDKAVAEGHGYEGSSL